MSFLDRWHNRRHDKESKDEPVSPKDDQTAEDALAAVPEESLSVSWATLPELAAIDSAQHSVTFAIPAKAGAAMDSLIPLVANVDQAAQEYGMAVVKFPEGVGWDDLCVRKRDGWKLLSSFGEDGIFNSMAGIKQAGLTPVGAANLALQVGAVAVGMAYMNQVNKQLTALQEGVAEVLKEMSFERDAALKTAFDDLCMLAERQEEFLATSEKRAQAFQIADRARHEADEVWNYQILAIRDWGEKLAKDKKATDEKAICEKIAELASMEARAACAYKLIAMSERISMGVDSDYSAERIEGARRRAKRLEDEYKRAVDPIEADLLDRIYKLGGLPLLVADAEDDGYESQNPLLDFAHEIGRQANRLNPVRMKETAEEDLESRKKDVLGKMLLANEVVQAEDEYAKQLEDLDFVFHKADALLIGNGQIKAISTHGDADSSEADTAEQE